MWERQAITIMPDLPREGLGYMVKSMFLKNFQLFQSYLQLPLHVFNTHLKLALEKSFMTAQFGHCSINVVVV